MSEPDDASLLTAHLKGDDHAFGVLMERHADRLWTLAVRMLRDPEEAAEALQEAMIAAFRRASGFRGEAAVTTWLHRIVVNACLDRLRRRKVRPTVPLPAGEGAPVLIADDDPADEAWRAALRDEVSEALAQISADQRAALVLVDMQGYPVDEAARLLGCAPGTVKSRCARGRAKLAALLQHLRTEVH